MKVNEALGYIQTNLVAPKDSFNSFGKYKYRSAESILEALKPLLKETKTTLVLNDDIQMVGDRIYVKATAILSDSEGASVSSSAFAREGVDKKGMDLSQLTGATSSYARKYAMSGLFCIDDNKDVDNEESTRKRNEASSSEKIEISFSSHEDAINQLKHAKTIDDIRGVFRAAWTEYNKTEYYDAIKVAYDDRKAVLESEA